MARSVNEYAERIVVRLKKDNPAKGSKIGIAVETKNKGDKIIARVRELMPDADVWTFSIIVVSPPVITEVWRV